MRRASLVVKKIEGSDLLKCMLAFFHKYGIWSTTKPSEWELNAIRETPDIINWKSKVIDKAGDHRQLIRRHVDIGLEQFYNLQFNKTDINAVKRHDIGNEINDWKDRRKPLDVGHLGFAKAFDKVSCVRLAKNLQARGIRGQACLLTWIQSWSSAGRR